MLRAEKKVHWDKVKSQLQALFIRRLHEEMKKQGLSDNALSARCDALKLPVGQSSVSRITGGRQDPSLENVHALAAALDLPAWYLLTEANDAGWEIIRPPAPPRRASVTDLPGYPATFTSASEPAPKSEHTGKKSRRARNK